jgi:hypothetical protein
MNEAPRYLLRDRDAIYGELFHRQADALRITEVPTAPRSPWQNRYADLHLARLWQQQGKRTEAHELRS